MPLDENSCDEFDLLGETEVRDRYIRMPEQGETVTFLEGHEVQLVSDKIRVGILLVTDEVCALMTTAPNGQPLIVSAPMEEWGIWHFGMKDGEGQLCAKPDNKIRDASQIQFSAFIGENNEGKMEAIVRNLGKKTLWYCEKPANSSFSSKIEVQRRDGVLQEIISSDGTIEFVH